MTVVIVEKQSVAKRIAKALGAGKKVPYVSHSDIHYWETILNGDNTMIAYAKGRLYELAPAAAYGSDFNKWSSRAFPCIPHQFKYTPLKDSENNIVSAYIECLAEALSKADKIICATDNDDSGENIFSYIYINLGRGLPVYRAIINNLNESSIRSAFNLRNLQSIETRASIIRAARCKDSTNWLWGINLTVLATQAYGNREKITIGTVQTPTLAAVVGLERSIKEHKSESSFAIKATFDRAKLPAVLSERFSEKETAESVVAALNNSVPTVTGYEQTTVTEKKPLLYNTTVLQSEICKKLKIKPTKAADILQTLYMKNLITYPRTEMQFLFESDKVQIKRINQALFDMLYKSCAVSSENWCEFTDRHFNDKKLENEAHSAIVPQMPIFSEIKRLTEQELAVYDMICRSVLSLVYDDAVYTKINMTITVGEYGFITSDKACTLAGWKSLFGEKTRISYLAQYQKGSVLKGVYGVAEIKSKPPARFNYSTLMLYMERAGKYIENEEIAVWGRKHRVMLGTNDTRPIIIQNLLDNGYIMVKNETIYPTEMGEYVINNFPIQELKKPDLVADMERRLYKVHNGEETPDKYMSDVIKKLKEWSVILKGVQIKEYVSEKERKFNCPLCGRQMKKSLNSWYCTGNFDKTCDFIIPLNIKKKKLTDKNVYDLISKGRTEVITGFRDDDDVEFSSSLAYDKYRRTISFLYDDESYVCPLCGGLVRKSKYAWYCTNKDKGCKFRINTIIAQKAISEADAVDLMTKGKTDVIEGFVSKKGTTFSCRLAYNRATNRIDFVYGKRKK